MKDREEMDDESIKITKRRAELLCSGENGMDALLAMGEVNANAIFPVEMLGEVLGAIDGAMLTTCAAEGEHEVGEATLEVTLNMMIGEAIDAVEEGEDLAVVLKEAYDGSVQAGELLVGLVTAGVVRGTTVEDVTAAVAAGVLGKTTLEGEGEDADNKRPTPRPPCEGGSGM